MADQIISFIPENDKAFERGLDRLAASTQDFRIPFGLIGNDWYRSNRKLFTLQSEGLYPPYGGFNFNERVTYRGRLTKKQEVAEVKKSEEVGFIFPMLLRKGALRDSILSRTARGAEYFVGKKDLVMGTRIRYGIFHQSDRPRKKLPQRKFIFIDGGPAEVARDAAIAGRRERWLNIINDYIKSLEGIE